MTAKTRPILRLTGFLLGGLLAAAVLFSGRMPASGAAGGARLTIETQPTAGLTVSAYARGERSVHLRATVQEPALDDVVQLEITAGGKRLFRGRLAELRRWTTRGFDVAGGETRKVHFSAWIPASVRDGYQGRSSELTLEWRTREASR